MFDLYTVMKKQKSTISTIQWDVNRKELDIRGGLRCTGVAECYIIMSLLIIRLQLLMDYVIIKLLIDWQQNDYIVTFILLVKQLHIFSLKQHLF